MGTKGSWPRIGTGSSFYRDSHENVFGQKKKAPQKGKTKYVWRNGELKEVSSYLGKPHRNMDKDIDDSLKEKIAKSVNPRGRSTGPHEKEN